MNYEDRLEKIELHSATMNNQMLIALAFDALSRIQSNQECNSYIQHQSAVVEAMLQELKNRI